MKKRRIDGTIVFLILTTAISTLGMRVNPWPTDGWYQTNYFLFGSFPGVDNYTPIAAPALLYGLAHAMAAVTGLTLSGEFYLASILQNLLLLLSACMVYYTLKLMRLTHFATPVAAGFLLFVLSTGLAQAFWSENVTLFLMAAVVLMLAVFLYDASQSQAKFWTRTIASSLLVGLLVITRVTPIVLIPGIALLFLRRITARRIVQFTGTLTVVSLLMMASMVLANHQRFGRYELTNSSGRHLWQGVREITDRALADSSDYQALKKLDPDVQGKNWWEVPPVPVYLSEHPYVLEDVREPLLEKLSKQAIHNAPALYLMQGARKFIRSIGAAPYRLGFDTFGIWNPLNRQDFLSAPSSSMGLPVAFSQIVEAAFRGIHSAFRWLYPISIFAIFTSWAAMIAEHLSGMKGALRIPSVLRTRVLPIGAFLSLGIVFAVIPIASYGLNAFAIAGSALCILLLGICTSILYRKLRQEFTAVKSRVDAPLFLFLALMFFGILWLSWQIEAADTRNTLPWLPLWSVMLAIVGTYWKGLWSCVRKPTR